MKSTTQIPPNSTNLLIKCFNVSHFDLSLPVKTFQQLSATLSVNVYFQAAATSSAICPLHPYFFSLVLFLMPLDTLQLLCSYSNTLTSKAVPLEYPSSWNCPLLALCHSHFSTQHYLQEPFPIPNASSPYLPLSRITASPPRISLFLAYNAQHYLNHSINDLLISQKGDLIYFYFILAHNPNQNSSFLRVGGYMYPIAKFNMFHLIIDTALTSPT